MTTNIIDINESTVKNFIESLRPKDPENRKQLDFGYSYDGKVYFLYRIRPDVYNPNKIRHLEFAKIRYFKSKQEYHLYWKRANQKWVLYQPLSKSSYLEKILDCIKKDRHNCFIG